MPHVSESRANSTDHANHDHLLVAALAAGDLSGTDRDHALELTRSCAPCAGLHDDLVAIARATATVPPIAPRPRDFQLTPADAARLRPAAWRRILGGIAAAPRSVTRPLGVGLATLGLVGLIVGNVPVLTSGGSAARPASGSAAGATSEESAASGAPGAGDAAVNPLSQPAASMAAAASAAASAGSEFGAVSASPSSAAGSYDRGGVDASQPIRAAANPGSTSTEGDATTEPLTVTTGETGTAVAGTSLNPLNVLFALAVVAGLGLLVASRIRGRSAG